MCLAIPGRIEEIGQQELLTMARVSFNGMIKEVCIEWVPDVKVGEYVIVHAGFAISILDEKEALENLKMINEVAQSPNAYHKW
ncbi:MAG: HypC/HybG/HupF family hydrogenase formation chaperone [Deltaproteobacteria bacterium]|jgi:hydrogenase expression/formation protein HypC|nr:HypC/HybG/HupF family hydrogenase formation chaperone [Deltaproteobacteria bacterium]MBT4268190.1 HypC/HybG/HupF family hydrogenase formation chaperone [Deltaproteobacteria bacterium]MBT4640181.1 HypC/HybG/HupF family hydrogenase formation chaperone [Deltaproteobacteria bacterium]MBT6614122.1 HypC/HybG/HupF family hydrogenase formation chaperone [Deltaproteobacteria bacterium]MBT7151812.1 HypC/HybG/HupF family hydrogenase formation chaperone [Deltaproteobacteria bacterium]